MAYETIIVAIEDHVATITLNRPDALNALSQKLLKELAQAMEEADALDLLNELLLHATQERFQYRHKWRTGDLVMWDNRCLLHKANGDYDHDTQTRYLYRVMLQGDRPV